MCAGSRLDPRKTLAAYRLPAVRAEMLLWHCHSSFVRVPQLRKSEPAHLPTVTRYLCAMQLCAFRAYKPLAALFWRDFTQCICTLCSQIIDVPSSTQSAKGKCWGRCAPASLHRTACLRSNTGLMITSRTTETIVHALDVSLPAKSANISPSPPCRPMQAVRPPALSTSTTRRA